MNTKIILTSATLFTGILAVVTTFLPQETVVYLGISPENFPVLVIQALGALYLGFTFLNGMSRHSVVGGIYSRPLVVANWAHFFTFGMALLKASFSGGTVVLWILTFVYLVLAALFGRLFFTGPKKD